jgi:hypothetical protein
MSTHLRACIALAIASTIGNSALAASTAPKKTLTAFANEAQLHSFFKKYADLRRAKYKSQGNLLFKADVAAAAPAMIMEASAPPPPAPAAAAESVTNTQTAGVDEGGIVKVHGDHLVMLRRGRLFTVAIGDGQLKSISAINAFAPDTGGGGAWYDEMLIAGDTIAVIGYSYGRGGTEIGLFDIDKAGKLSYRSTYHMRSNDYYSANNYASRQIGSKLIFYTPLQLGLGGENVAAQLPSLRKWRPDATPRDFKRIAPATRIYRTDDPIGEDADVALHTVTVCDLAQRDMRCEATAVLGPNSRVFYASGESVYVWTTTGDSARRGGKSGLFRIPLDGSAPSALKVAGAPVDQFSFLESADGYLNVLVSETGLGEGMWRARQGTGELALMRVALNSFSDGKDSAPARSYRPLPNPGGWGIQNRYVGPYLLYGVPGQPDPHSQKPAVHPLRALRWAEEGKEQALSLPHGVERIEAMGADAVVIGSSGKDLHFTSIALAAEATPAHRYVHKNAAQGETRSHGFFYKAVQDQQGMIGLPVLRNDDPQSLQQHGAPASVLYLRNVSRKLSELGSLKAGRPRQLDDGCVASCVDWYGNARPLFLKGRVFALMGYELVEGRVGAARIKEVGRVSFAPSAAQNQQ